MENERGCIASAEHWERLAEEAQRMAAWDRSRGIDLSAAGQSPGDHKARVYLAVARSLRLEAKTGVPHCACHEIPEQRCPSMQRRIGG